MKSGFYCFSSSPVPLPLSSPVRCIFVKSLASLALYLLLIKFNTLTGKNLSSGIVNAVLSHEKNKEEKERKIEKEKSREREEQEKLIANYKLNATGRHNFLQGR